MLGRHDHLQQRVEAADLLSDVAGVRGRDLGVAAEQRSPEQERLDGLQIEQNLHPQREARIATHLLGGDARERSTANDRAGERREQGPVRSLRSI